MLVAYSEFGDRNISTRRVHRPQPSLTDFDNGDLKPITDFRDIYATLLTDALRADPRPILGPGRTTLPLIATRCTGTAD